MKARSLRIFGTDRIPGLSLLLGFGPVLLLAIGVILSVLARGAMRAEISCLTTLFAAAIVTFLGGVRRD